MDTSEIYAKMCDCSEIQEKWSPVEGDCFWTGMFISIATDYDNWTGNVDYVKRFPKAVWLPRQDQIQEMLGCEDTQVAHHRLYQLAQFWIGYDLKSMEQLWLAFYMQEKYHKRWDRVKWA